MTSDKRQQLPIGSVVNILEDNITVVIIGQFPVVETEFGKGYFDFVGAIPPIGFDPKNNIFFNKEDINGVVFLGYVDIEFQNFIEKAEEFEKTTPLEKLETQKK